MVQFERNMHEVGHVLIAQASEPDSIASGACKFYESIKIVIVGALRRKVNDVSP